MSFQFLLAVLTAGSFLPIVSAQSNSAQLSIGGMVINDSTGEPVKRALVQVVERFPEGPSATDRRPRTPNHATTFTDAAGTFRFPSLSPGEYAISARKPEFVPARTTDEEASTIKLTASLESVKLRLSPLGVIIGKVVDQSGEPVRSVNVIALSVLVDDGLRQTKVDRNVSTDDRGMYRLWNMSPGRYYIKATGRTGGTVLFAGDTTPQFFADEAFAPVYFGGANQLDSAAPITIEPGTEAHADLSLNFQPSYKLRGSVSNFVPRQSVKFELLNGGEDVTASRGSMNSDTGSFEILDVIPGSYVLRASQGNSSAELHVTLKGDQNGVSLALAPGVDIRILTRFTNPPSNPSTEGPTFFHHGRDGNCETSLHPEGTRSATAHRSLWVANEESELKSIPVGSYRVAVECHGAYAQSVSSGAQDLLTQPILSVQPGVTPSPIEIVATRGGGTILGTVSAPSARGTSGLRILVVPQFSRSTGPVFLDELDAPDQPGVPEFSVPGLAPGAYTVYAFTEGVDVEFRNPQFLRSLSGGVAVQIDDNQEKSVTITGVAR